jgi:hypothetical protein
MPLEDKKREEIRKEAKLILDKFSKALSKVESKESNVEREQDRRMEGNGEEQDPEFREIMFENAPSSNKDFIIAEKKSW